MAVNGRSAFIPAHPGFSYLEDQQVIDFHRPALQDKVSCPCLQNLLHVSMFLFFFAPLVQVFKGPVKECSPTQSSLLRTHKCVLRLNVCPKVQTLRMLMFLSTYLV